MLINIPFYENNEDGNQCLQVAMKSVLKYFFDKEYSLNELDKLTGRKAGFWTWTPQIVTVLHDLGLKVEYYSKTDLKPFLEGEAFIRKHFGKDAEKILKYTDLPVVLKSITKVLDYNVFKKEKLTIEDIEAHLKQGHIPMATIDHNKISGKKGLYQGHFVVITGFDEDHIFYHESGPENAERNKKVSKLTFLEAFNANGTDNDLVIVYGKKNK